MEYVLKKSEFNIFYLNPGPLLLNLAPDIAYRKLLQIFQYTGTVRFKLNLKLRCCHSILGPATYQKTFK